MQKIIPSQSSEIDVGTLLDKGGGPSGRGLIVRVTDGGFVWFMTASFNVATYFFTGGDSWTAMPADGLDAMKK